MTNEEKTRELVNEYGFLDYRDRDCSIKSIIKMAEWKDHQFKDILKRKLAEYHKKYETSIELDERLLWGGKEDAIGLLLLELFGEDSIDY